MSPKSSRRGFTLIEVLVVVAIIALLIAILLPSLNRARQQAKLVACESNIRQLTLATMGYASESKGLFPADKWSSQGFDWYGAGNKPGQKPPPEGGSIWKYMGKSRDAYLCPDDPRLQNANRGFMTSYSMNVLMTGGKAEWINGAHHPVWRPSSNNMNRSDHALAYNGAVDMKRFDGAPLFAEEDMSNITAVSDGAWMRDDGFEARHLKGSNASVPGSASISYTDGHVGSVKLPMDKKNPNWKNVYFTADAMCIRTRSKWISGNDAQVNKGDANFGIIGKSANTTKRTH